MQGPGRFITDEELNKLVKAKVNACVNANKNKLHAKWVKEFNDTVKEHEDLLNQKAQELIQYESELKERERVQTEMHKNAMVKVKAYLSENNAAIADEILNSTEALPILRQLPRHADCKSCIYNTAMTSRLAKKLAKASVENVNLEALKATVKRYEQRMGGMANNNSIYIKGLEDKLRTYFEDFDNWQKGFMNSLFFIADIRGDVESITAELAIKKDQLLSVTNQLKETMRYKDYTIASHTKLDLQAKVRQLESTLSSTQKISKPMLWLDQVKQDLDLSPAEVKSAVLLGLGPETNLANFKSIIAEVSVYHQDKQLFERVEGLKAPSELIKSREIIKMTPRHYLSLKHWQNNVSSVPMREVELVDEVCDDVGRQSAHEPTIDIIKHEDVSKLRSEVHGSTQLLHEVIMKTNKILHDESRKAMMNVVSDSYLITELQCKLQGIHTAIVKGSVEGVEYEDAPKNMLDILKKLRTLGYDVDPTKSVESLLINLEQKVLFECRKNRMDLMPEDPVCGRSSSGDERSYNEYYSE